MTKHFIPLLYLVLLSLFSHSLSAQDSEFTQHELNIKLFNAAKGGYTHTCEQLIDMGADVNYRNQTSEYPLHAAASTGQLAIIKLLKRMGAKDNPRTVNGWIPLHHAVRFGHVQIASYLLATGAPLYLRTADGKSVFDIAEATGDQHMINVLQGWKLSPR